MAKDMRHTLTCVKLVKLVKLMNCELMTVVKMMVNKMKIVDI